jgi:hypothetical protein
MIAIHGVGQFASLVLSSLHSRHEHAYVRAPRSGAASGDFRPGLNGELYSLFLFRAFRRGRNN